MLKCGSSQLTAYGGGRGGAGNEEVKTQVFFKGLEV